MRFQNNILKLCLHKQTFQFYWFSVKSSRFWIQEKQDKRLLKCTFAAVRTNADPEGELTNPRRSAKSSKIMISARFEVHEVSQAFFTSVSNLKSQTSASFRKFKFQALAIKSKIGMQCSCTT